MKTAPLAAPSPTHTVPIPVVLVAITAGSPVTQGAVGLTATATATSAGTYQWSVSGGTLTGGQGTPTITYSADQAGPITLQCSVTDASGVMGSVAATVSVIPAPIATITTAPAVSQGATGLPASVPVQDGCTYAWTITGGTLTGDASSHAITYSAGDTGSLKLTCTVTNQAGDEVTGQAVVQDSALDVSGTYTDGFGITFTLFQSGTRVWGTRTYGGVQGPIAATLNGNVLSGTWVYTSTTYAFNWTFTPDASSFSGLYAAFPATPNTVWTGTKKPGVSIQITPTSALMQTGATQAFQAFVAGSSDKAVAWTATGGALVDAEGVFTAPTGIGANYTVTATSHVDATKAAAATVQATPTGVMDVSGTYADGFGITFTLFQNGTKVWGTRTYGGVPGPIVATLNGNVLSGTWVYTSTTYAFNWTFAPGASSFSGLFAASPTTPNIVWTGTKQAGVSAQISPTFSIMKVGTTKGFTSFVAGSFDKGLTYSVAGGGSISQDGTYAAPATPCYASITATPESDPTKAVTAKVEVTSDGFLDVSGTYYEGNYPPFYIRVYQRGTALTIATDTSSMVWQGTLNGLTATGTIVASATPAYIGTGFTLSFSADGSSLTGTWNTGPGASDTGSSIVTHTRQAGVVSTWIAPSFQVAKVGTTAQVSAIVGGSLDKNLAYSVTGGGSISQDGAYSAPTYGCNAVVTAAPEADSTKSASARIEVTSNGMLDVSGTYYNGNFTPFNLKIYQQGTALTIFTDTSTMVWKGTLSGLVATGTIISATTPDYLNKGFSLTFSQDGSSLTGVWDTGPGGASNGAGTSIVTHTRQMTVSLWLQPLQSTLYPTWSEGLLVQVAGSVDKRLAWSVQETAAGTVGADGVYTAPPALGTFHVQAAAVASPSATATATIQVAVVGL
ncbi:MAG: hypothetical protein JST24_01920, partial [Acidobacteria bacterium]|nr:hypothetical protein [Acidobacteriota bacterium]